MCYEHKKMKIICDSVLLLMMYLVAVYSLPAMQQRTRKQWKMTRREVNMESSANFNATPIDQQLANLSIPGYLKELYINLTYPNGAARLNYEHTKINTVQTYKNQGKSMLNNYVL